VTVTETSDNSFVSVTVTLHARTCQRCMAIKLTICDTSKCDTFEAKRVY